jgi:CheY-like chemotaxis protein
MQILLVEDEAPKRRHVEAYARELLPAAQIEFANSVRSAIQCLSVNLPDLLILDMSLPTFDVGQNEAGGRPQGFGGVELLRNMELEEMICPVIVLTGYDAFTKAGGQVGLDVLRDELAEAHPTLFKGILHFNSAYGDWQDRFRALCIELGLVK